MSGAQQQDKKQWAQSEEQEVLSEHQEILLHCAGYSARAQSAQRGCGISVLGDFSEAAWILQVDMGDSG